MEPKAVNRQFIDPEKSREVYDMMRELIVQHHPELVEAQICLFWRYGIKPNKDGQIQLGQCKKISDFDRELSDYDFAIVLNHDFWFDAETTDVHRRALLDHELCHAAPVYEDPDASNPVQRRTESTMVHEARLCWRIRKHDVEEFSEIIERHGLWTHELQRMARKILAREELPLLQGTEDEDDE